MEINNDTLFGEQKLVLKEPKDNAVWRTAAGVALPWTSGLLP